MSPIEVHPTGPLVGAVEVPGDKSVSHRALMLGALASGPSRVVGLLESGDVAATLQALRGLGAHIEHSTTETVVRPGPIRTPDAPLHCGNSGTTLRLLAGWAAAAPVEVSLIGDASLSRRPMARVVDPLRAMGARVMSSDGRPPLHIHGGALTADTRHDLAIASAQVKSCLLLAGRDVGVWVREPRASRDHTERMLRAMGAPLTDEGGGLRLDPVQSLDPVEVRVPRDLSAAAFWLVAASIVPGSALHLPGVGTNPTRAGVLEALQAMGADLDRDAHDDGVEPVADLSVRHASLQGVPIEGSLALRCLDELPVLAVAAAFARGTTVIRDAAELRVKESDRIARVVAGLRSLGVSVEARPDGMVIEGGEPVGPGQVDAHGDHRIAMAFAIAGAACPGGVRIDGAESVSSSYPEFFTTLAALQGLG